MAVVIAAIPDAKQPELCPQCLADMLTAVEAGGNGQCVKYCDENLVFAVATGRLGVVVMWDIRGPILLDAAEHLQREYIAHYAARGVIQENPKGFN